MPQVYSATQTFTSRAFNIISDSLYVTEGANMVGQANDALINTSAAYIQNNGNITNTYDCLYLYNASQLLNTGTISATGSGFSWAVAMLSNTSPASANLVMNSGRILNSSTNSSSAAVHSAAGGTILNDGLIASYRAGYAIDAANYSIAITNRGTVAGTVFLSDQADNVTNDGTITGTMLLNNGTNLLGNHGLIQGSIFFGQDADSILNSGTIIGNVTLGSGLDTLNNLNGRIIGDVDLSDGNDSLDNTFGVITGNLIGGTGDDTITGGSQKDTIYGDTTNLSAAGGGSDKLYGLYGDDTIYGGSGADTIQGNQGNDVLYGGADNDFLHGGQDSDQLYGEAGDDILNGGLGADVLTGGAGNDTFTYALNFGRDTIADFSGVSGNFDVIRFQAGTFGNYADVQNHMVQQGNNVVIELNVNDSVVLLNTTTTALTGDHFIFG